MTADPNTKTPHKRYMVVVEASLPDLEDDVCDLIEEGYVPLGGMCVYIKTFSGGGHRLRFAQAMLWRQGD